LRAIALVAAPLMPAADEEQGIEEGEHGQANERHPLAHILEEEAAEGHGHEAADGQARDHEAHGARPLAVLHEQVGDHGEAAGGGDGAAEALEGARGKEPVEGGCGGEDEGGGEVDEEAGEHWRVVAEVVDERAHERVHNGFTSSWTRGLVAKRKPTAMSLPSYSKRMLASITVLWVFRFVMNYLLIIIT